MFGRYKQKGEDMKRTEAEELYGKQVIATQLIDLTNSVADEALNILRDFYPQGITGEVLDLLDKEENMEIFYDKIFDAVQECFTLPQIKILNQSNPDSGNYHLMYKRLHEHFKEKIAEAGIEEPPILLQADYDELYDVLFREMENCTPEPCDKNPNMWREIAKSREIDYKKIQERFKD